MLDEPTTSWRERPGGLTPEFPHEEIEVKFRVAGPARPEILSDAVRVLRDGVPIVELPDSAIGGMAIHYDYYAANRDGTLEPAFHICDRLAQERRLGMAVREIFGASVARYDPSLVKVIKTKTELTSYPLACRRTGVTALRRRKDRQIAWEGLTDEDVADVVRAAAASLQAEIVRLPRLTRKARRRVVRNLQSTRVYELCFDSCAVLGRHLHQLEIDYMGCVRQATPRFGEIAAVLEELALVSDLLLASPLGDRLTPTTLTKFAWLVDLDAERHRGR